MLKILELFGGIGSPRIALRNIGVPVKSIDYVEVDEKAVRSYNAMFRDDLAYTSQDVRGWNLKPDILIHGSPCQDFSIAGRQQGADPGSETRSSLMWETINIVRNMGVWRPRIIIWENVKNVLSRHMVRNYQRYVLELSKLGYVSNYAVLNAMDFGLPQRRERVFTISTLSGREFDFSKMHRMDTLPIKLFLETGPVDDYYTITAPSMIRAIGKTNCIRRIPVITNYCYTITERPDRAPGSGCLPIGGGKYRYLTERECWRLQGYSDDDFASAAAVNTRRTLYKQAGNSIPVTIFESMFKEILKL
ncbi:DNA cytosine methyltransferase [uncultured Megasphaera sp.]|uniref:DNA cytosine methyltransferase n=1 Tax=uncultured Megasphaera sp. TaxID=165188 RepID=UPI0025E55A68|nr:DNA cytosine methyltransferase [uncultured Megasphaera sp.]